MAFDVNPVVKDKTVKGTRKDKKMRIMGLTDYLIELPPVWKSLLLIFIVSTAVGIVSAFLLTNALNLEILIYGSATGFFLLGLPAILTGISTNLATRALKQRLIIKRSMYLAFFSMAILSALYLTASFLQVKGFYTILDLLIYGYVLVFMVSTFVLTVTYPMKVRQTITLSLLHPLFGYVFLANAGLLARTFPAIPPLTISLLAIITKICIALTVLAIGVLLFILMINAPMKRNFGIKTFQLAKVFISHWYHGSMEIESTLAKISEKANVLVGIIVFRAKDAKKNLKALLIVPYVHPGPFGLVGGAKLTKVFTETLGTKINAPVLIAHGTATHDLNPVSTESLYKITSEISANLNDIKYNAKATHSVHNNGKYVKFIGQRLGDSLFTVSTFSPRATEDIDFSIGTAVMNEIKENYENVIYADAHNCHQEGEHAVFSGSPMMFDLQDGMKNLSDKVKKQRLYNIKLGIGTDSLNEFTLKQGVGPTGLKTAVFETNGQKTAYVIFDANNMAAGLREKIINAVKKTGIDECEVMTTDSHCVNNVRGVENPLGEVIDQQILITKAVETTKQALQDLTFVEVGVKKIMVKDIDVLGPHKTAELVATTNSMIAIMKIVAPIIFIVGTTLSLLGVLLVPW